MTEITNDHRVSQGVVIDWNSIPKGFDYIIMNAFYVLASNTDPIYYDAESNDYEPKSMDELQAENPDAQMGVVHVTDIGKQMEQLIAEGLVTMSNVDLMVPPLVIYKRPLENASVAECLVVNRKS